MARKIRAYRELKSRPRESQRFDLDYETMKRPLTGKMLPVLAWQDVRRESRLFSLLSSIRMFGVGRLFTRKSWLEDHPEPSYWEITKVKVDYTAQVREMSVQVQTWVINFTGLADVLIGWLQPKWHLILVISRTWIMARHGGSSPTKVSLDWNWGFTSFGGFKKSAT